MLLPRSSLVKSSLNSLHSPYGRMADASGLPFARSICRRPGLFLHIMRLFCQKVLGSVGEIAITVKPSGAALLLRE